MVLITLSALFILYVKNPLYAVFGLMLVFINSAILLLSFEVNFLALVYVVLYVGAICVLFLFVVMLLNLRAYDIHDQRQSKNELLPFFLSCLFGIVYHIKVTITEVHTALLSGNYIESELHETNLVPSFLFQSDMVLVLLTLLLFLAIVSPIMMHKKQVISKKQDIFNSSL